MKEWKKPEISELDIMQTAHGNGNGKEHGNGHGYDFGPGMGPGNGNGYGHQGKPGGGVCPPGWPWDDEENSMS